MQFLPGKFGPQYVRCVKFAVSALPQQEIAQPKLSAGPDQQIRVRYPRGIEVARQHILCQFIRLYKSHPAVLCKARSGMDQLRPPSVVDADAAKASRQPVRDGVAPVHQFFQLAAEWRHVPHEAQAHIIPLHGLDGLQQIPLQQLHDGVHLLLRPLPVLGGEGVDRQVLDADVPAVGGDGAEGLRPGGVAGLARQATAFGPAAVPVHDDGG